jgi:hypothetical protein
VVSGSATNQPESSKSMGAGGAGAGGVGAGAGSGAGCETGAGSGATAGGAGSVTGSAIGPGGGAAAGAGGGLGLGTAASAGIGEGRRNSLRGLEEPCCWPRGTASVPTGLAARASELPALATAKPRVNAAARVAAPAKSRGPERAFESAGGNLLTKKARVTAGRAVHTTPIFDEGTKRLPQASTPVRLD